MWCGGRLPSGETSDGFQNASFHASNRHQDPTRALGSHRERALQVKIRGATFYLTDVIPAISTELYLPTAQNHPQNPFHHGNLQFCPPENFQPPFLQHVSIWQIRIPLTLLM